MSRCSYESNGYKGKGGSKVSEKDLQNKEAMQKEEESQMSVCGKCNLKDVQETMPSYELLTDLADLFKLFGDSTRLAILSALRQHELCVGDLAEVLNMTQSAISHQLKSLRLQNLVTYRRDGRLSYYSLADEHVETIIDMGLEHILEEA